MKDSGESISAKLYEQLLLEFESKQPMQIFKVFSEDEPVAVTNLLSY